MRSSRLSAVLAELGTKTVATATAATLMALGPIFVTLSKTAGGTYDYSVPVSTMVTELLKLLLSAVLLLSTRLRAGDEPTQPLLHSGSLREFGRYMIPAFIYFVNNNLIFFILLAIDPTTFQLLSQMKTIFTGLLFRCFLGRQLSAVQYTALITLACGTATAQIPSVGEAGEGEEGEEGEILKRSAALGLLLSVISALLSSLGGIYSEKLLKGRTVTLHWQNVQLYLWGVVFNALGAYWKDGEAIRDHGLLAGFAFWAWAVVLCNALAGLAISAVLKFADNIARVYAHAVAMVATMFLSVRLFGSPVTPQLVIGMTLVANSTYQYHAVAHTPAATATADAADAAAEASDPAGASPGGRQSMLSMHGIRADALPLREIWEMRCADSAEPIGAMELEPDLASVRDAENLGETSRLTRQPEGP